MNYCQTCGGTGRVGDDIPCPCQETVPHFLRAASAVSPELVYWIPATDGPELTLTVIQDHGGHARAPYRQVKHILSRTRLRQVWSLAGAGQLLGTQMKEQFASG